MVGCLWQAAANVSASPDFNFFPKNSISRFLFIVCYILPSQFTELPIQTLPPVQAAACVDFLDRGIGGSLGRLDPCHQIVQRSALVKRLRESNGLVGTVRKSLGILSSRADRLVCVQIVEHGAFLLKDHVGRPTRFTVLDHVDPRVSIVDLGELANSCLARGDEEVRDRRVGDHPNKDYEKRCHSDHSKLDK